MSEITAVPTLEESQEAMRKSVIDFDEIFYDINPQDPEYLERLERDLENWKINGQGEDETIKGFLEWRGQHERGA